MIANFDIFVADKSGNDGANSRILAICDQGGVIIEGEPRFVIGMYNKMAGTGIDRDELDRQVAVEGMTVSDFMKRYAPDAMIEPDPEAGA